MVFRSPWILIFIPILIVLYRFWSKRQMPASFRFSSTMLLSELGSSVPATYSPISAFPTVERDVAFVVPVATEYAALSSALSTVDPLIKKVELFDVFRGGLLSAGHKSLALHLTYSLDHRTLASAEVDEAEKKVFAMLEKKFQAEIRK